MTPEIWSVAGRRSGMAAFISRDSFCHGWIGLGDPQEADSAGVASREGLGLVGAFHKCKATFWATFERHRRHETAPSLAKNTSVAMQQRLCTERARHLFSADLCQHPRGSKAGAVRQRSACSCHGERHCRCDPVGRGNHA